MFRIQENLDGTTSIYCKNNGNLLCKIPKKGTSSVPRPVNVVGPQPSNAKWLNNRRYSANENPGQRYKKEESPIPSDNEDPKADPVDGGSQEGFLRFFDLVPTERLRATPREQLLAEWPLRKISRSRSCLWHLKEDKIPEQLPLASPWAVRLLPLMGKGLFIQEEKLQVLLRSYDSFCRHPYNTACGTSCHFPKLRCREKKQYAISTPSKVLRNLDAAHTYSIGRRQREERKRTLRTGLDAQSRRLFRKFNAIQCKVRLQRLPQAEIDDWLSRRSPSSDKDDSDVEILEADPTYRPSRKVAALPPLRTRRGKVKEIVPKAKKVNPGTRQCKVRLRDVVWDIRRRNNTYYYKDTCIRVPFYRDFLNSLRANRPLLNRVYNARCVDPTSAFKRIAIPTKPSTSFQDVFMAKRSNAAASSRQVVQAGTKRTAFKAFKDQASTKKTAFKATFQAHPPPAKVAQQKLVKPAQRQISKVGQQKTQQTTSRISGKMQLKPVAAQKSPVVLDLDTNSSAIRQLMKSPVGKKKSAAVVLYQQQQAENSEEEEDIPLIDLTEDSPPRPQQSSGRNLVGPSSGSSRASLCPLSLKGPVPGPSGLQARRQSLTRPLVHQLVGHPTNGQFPVMVGRPSPETSSARRASLETSSRQVVIYQSQVSSQDQRSFVVSRWNFRCFACGFQKYFYGPQDQPRDVESAVRDHLRLFHYVLDPEAFLSRYLDSVNRCTMIEAFPGFKESED